jgi:hypothetical protein
MSVTPTTTENIATATTASAQTAVAAIPAAEGKCHLHKQQTY